MTTDTKIFIAGTICAGLIIAWSIICAHTDLLARTRTPRTKAKRLGFNVWSILH